MNTLADRLKKYREAKKMSVSEVAKRVGVSQSTYREWEYGRKIKGEPYLRLAETLGVSLNTLLTGEESKLENEFLKLEEIVKRLKSLL